MLYDNEEVLKYLNEEKGKLIHLFGDADAGRTQTLFSILNRLTENDKFVSYWIPRQEEFRQNVFNETVQNKKACLIGFPKTSQELSTFMQLARNTDLICIDNFLEYVLHKPKAFIRGVLARLSATTYQYKTNFIIVNDLRYLEAKGGLHPAYQEYFRHFCSRHIVVEKDSDFHISYRFTKI